jgi:hypothetical protein
MNRRGFVTSTTAALLSAGGIWYGFDGKLLLVDDDAAYSSWAEWQAGGEPKPLQLVRAAILASSPHNTQPWRFRVGESFVELYLETDRSVRGLDPYLREAHIGMGCALENLALSAAASGFTTAISVPDGRLDGQPIEPPMRLVARVDLSPCVPRESELHAAIPKRHTNRSLYDRSAELPSRFVEEVLALCNAEDEARLFLISEPQKQDDLSRISAEANFELYSDPQVEKGSEQWIRWRPADVRKFQDGLTIDNFGLPPATAAFAKIAPVWLLKRASSPDHRSALYARQMRSASLIGIIAVRDRMSQRQSLLAGRVWQRAHLLATARGVAARPCNEAIEMIDHERHQSRPSRRLSALAGVLGDSTWQPTFLFLMGKPTQSAHLSPRRTLERVIAS